MDTVNKNNEINEGLISRKGFLGAFGILSAGFFVFRLLPIKVFSSSSKNLNLNEQKKLAIKINPLSVKRETTGGNNVG